MSVKRRVRRSQVRLRRAGLYRRGIGRVTDAACRRCFSGAYMARHKRAPSLHRRW
jgi:hypothetical protein